MAADAAAVPLDVRALAELLLERLRADAGHWVVRLEATDGVLHKWSREERGGATALAGFGDPHVS